MVVLLQWYWLTPCGGVLVYVADVAGPWPVAGP